MSVYLSAPRYMANPMRVLDEQLTSNGYEVVSDWYDRETPADRNLEDVGCDHAPFGESDKEKVDSADVLICFTESAGHKGLPLRRGEHMFELARFDTVKEVPNILIVGPEENQFVAYLREMSDTASYISYFDLKDVLRYLESVDEPQEAEETTKPEKVIPDNSETLGTGE